MDLEKELRSALQRSDPPPGFAERVLARAADAGGDPHPARWRLNSVRPLRLRWAIAAGLAAVAGFTGAVKYQQRRGEVAKERLITALYIAGEKLNYAQRKVHEVRLPGAAAAVSNIGDKQ
jgi:hypothetical protein